MPDRAFAQEFVARYTVVMKIVILQVLRGLLAGRFDAEMEEYLGDSKNQTRAYMVALLRKMNFAFGHITYRLLPDSFFASVHHADNSTDARPLYEKVDDSYVINLAEGFFRLAAHSLHDFEFSGSRVGTLLHEISHVLKDERITLHKADGWDGDAPHDDDDSTDDGRLGTYDYAYQENIYDLSARDKRHNADSVQYFIEMAVLKERKAGRGGYPVTEPGVVASRPDIAVHATQNTADEINGTLEEQGRIVMEGFPDEDVNATSRTLFNGEYVESVAQCVNGKPTYTNDKNATIYFCKANHRWHITLKEKGINALYGKGGKCATKEEFEEQCPNFVAFKARVPLAVAANADQQVEYVWVGGLEAGPAQRRAWEKSSKHIPAGEYQEKDAWVSNVRISQITGNDEDVCQ